MMSFKTYRANEAKLMSEAVEALTEDFKTVDTLIRNTLGKKIAKTGVTKLSRVQYDYVQKHGHGNKDSSYMSTVSSLANTELSKSAARRMTIDELLQRAKKIESGSHITDAGGIDGGKLVMGSK